MNDGKLDAFEKKDSTNLLSCALKY